MEGAKRLGGRFMKRWKLIASIASVLAVVIAGAAWLWPDISDVLWPNQRIIIRVVTPDGQPLSSLIIKRDSKPGQWVTDADGRVKVSAELAGERVSIFVLGNPTPLMRPTIEVDSNNFVEIVVPDEVASGDGHAPSD